MHVACVTAFCINTAVPQRLSGSRAVLPQLPSAVEPVVLCYLTFCMLLLLDMVHARLFSLIRQHGSMAAGAFSTCLVHGASQAMRSGDDTDR